MIDKTRVEQGQRGGRCVTYFAPLSMEGLIASKQIDIRSCFANGGWMAGNAGYGVAQELVLGNYTCSIFS
jgi:hypothetical protein